MSRVPVRYDLIFTGVSPAYVYHDRPEWKPLFSGHLDQACTTTGSLTIGHQSYSINGLGARDRSWGTRDWAYPRMWRYVTLVSNGFSLMVWYTEADHGIILVDGFVQDGEDFTPVVSYREAVQTIAAQGKPIPRSLSFEVTTETGQTYRVEGEVLQVMPVVFSKSKDGAPLVSWNDRALLRYRLSDGGIAYGNIEFGERVATEADLETMAKK